MNHLPRSNHSLGRDDYFDEDDTENDFESNNQRRIQENISDVNEIDPLDAFMSGVEETVRNESQKIATGITEARPEILSMNDVDGLDEYQLESARDDLLLSCDQDDEYADYDSDDQLRRNPEGNTIQPLRVIDHSSISYSKFRKNFYRLHPEIILKSDDDINELLDKLELSVHGEDVPPPLERFEHACFDAMLLLEIYRHGYQHPTPIQAQAIPVALSGRDMIGLAKTGSGKTLAFVWPMLVHVTVQPRLNPTDGPIGLILAPTRELVQQIYHETNKFGKVYDINTCAIYGGAGKYEMTKALKNSPHIVVATPGRLIDMVKIKSTNFIRCTMVVLDEADRMFDMGFESQITCILNNIRGDRQILLFSATMKKKIEDFVRKSIEYPSSTIKELGAAYSGIDKGIVRLIVGQIGQANPDIQQTSMVMKSEAEKWSWLSRNIDDFISSGKVLIFVSGKQDTEDLSRSLCEYFNYRQLVVKVKYLHGDIDQSQRTQIVKRFSRQKDAASDIMILVATDIASRGLDIKNIHTVINYMVPKNIDTYIHRIGRTGRLNVTGVKPGTAYTILTTKDSSFAVDLINVLGTSNQSIPQDLQLLAETDSKWSKMKYGTGTQQRGGGGFNAGIGLGSRKAMTSEMLANESKQHVTTSQASSSTTMAKTVINSNNYNTNNYNIQVDSSPYTSSCVTTTAPLKGFVRSSQQLASVQPSSSVTPAALTSSSVLSVNDGDKSAGQRKRSRWDA